MQDFECSGMWFGSIIFCESPNWEVRKSSPESSKLVRSFEQQSSDLELKSPIMTVRSGFRELDLGN